MKNQSKNTGIIINVLVGILLLAILNVCTFAIPYPKVSLAVHYTIYGCSEFMVLFAVILAILNLQVEKDRSQKILGLPILYWSYVMLGVQVIASIILYVTNAFVSCPIWLVVLLECILLCLTFIQVAKGYFFKAKSKEYHENVANTEAMDTLRARLSFLKSTNGIASLSAELEDVLDIAKGSDPVGNKMTQSVDAELVSILDELQKNIQEGSEEKSRNSVREFKNKLLERNALCKAGK